MLEQAGNLPGGNEGLEQTQQFPKKSRNAPFRNAEYNARSVDSGAIDPGLQSLGPASLSQSARKSSSTYRRLIRG